MDESYSKQSIEIIEEKDKEIPQIKKEQILLISKGISTTLESGIPSAPNFYRQDRSAMDIVYDKVPIVRANSFTPKPGYKRLFKDKYRMNDSSLDFTAKSNF